MTRFDMRDDLPRVVGGSHRDPDKRPKARGCHRPWWTSTPAMYQFRNAHYGRSFLIAGRPHPPERSEAYEMWWLAMEKDRAMHLRLYGTGLKGWIS